LGKERLALAERVGSGNEYLTGCRRIFAIARFCENDVGAEWSVADVVLAEAPAWAMV